MKNKWWNEIGSGICATKEEAPDATPLAMDNLAGVFVVLTVGSCGAILYGIISWALFIFNKAKHYNVSLSQHKYQNHFRICFVLGASQRGFQGRVQFSYRL